MDILNTILSYLPTAIIAVIIFLFAFDFIKGEKSKIKEWLIWAVTESERLLGSGTGKLKIRQVYDWFIAKFPVFSTLISYETFAVWVDEALVTMRELIDKNQLIDEYVNRNE